MNKFKQFKKAVKDTPPDRLAKIEYRSHFMQMLGISIVCVILIIKGLWYIIFAFIFGISISYTQGITAYRKYQNIIVMLGKENPKDFDSDVSPTRRKDKIITHVFGSTAKWCSIIVSVMLTFLIIPRDISRWLMILAYLITIPVFYVLLYFFFFYWVAYPRYKREMKGVKKK